MCEADIRNLGKSATQILNLSKGQIAALYPDIPWKEMRGLRNHFVHEYLSIDEASIINTAIDDIPALKPLIRGILSDISGGSCDIGL